MIKNIEIQVKDETYERLKRDSINYDMDLQSYITMLIEQNHNNIRQNHNYIEEKVKKPLQKILTDLETSNTYHKENSNLFNKVLLLPLKKYNKALSKEFSRIIEYYKSRDLYDEENFYLITDGKRILGYMGLNISEEDAPYGRYIFIYALSLYKDYQSIGNLKYIINFVQSIGRQNQCYSIDILLENSNFTYNQLNELGFLLFTSTDIIKINIETDKAKVSICNLKTEATNIEDLGEFLPICRAEPLKSMISQWISKKEMIEVHRAIYKDEEEIEFMYVREDKSFNRTMYNCFTLLVRPEYLYDDKYIYKVLPILELIISQNIDKYIRSIVMIPRDLNKNSSIYNEDDVLDTLNWLRKNNS